MVKRLFRYIKGTVGFGVRYKMSGSEKLEEYSDNDYARDLDDCRSTSGYAFMLSSGVVSWSSKK